ncbi:hypothetical protein [Enterovibrio makurazakiensis]
MKQHVLEFTVDILNDQIGDWLETVAHQRVQSATGIKPQRSSEK